MTSGTRLSPGEVVLVPFPFTDLKASKTRPALVMSRAAYNQSSRDVILCGVTSNLDKAAYSVLIRQQDLAAGKLLATSRVKVDKVVSLEQGLVRKRVGRLKPAVYKRILGEFRALFEAPG